MGHHVYMQIIGALIVAAGVCLAAAPSDAGSSIFQKVKPILKSDIWLLHHT